MRECDVTGFLNCANVSTLPAFLVKERISEDVSSFRVLCLATGNRSRVYVGFVGEDSVPSRPILKCRDKTRSCWNIFHDELASSATARLPGNLFTAFVRKHSSANIAHRFPLILRRKVNPVNRPSPPPQASPPPAA